MSLVPILTILPSLTAIAGEFFLAKIETPVAFGLESTGTAALPVATRFALSALTLLSAYLDGAATGK